ncbi:CBS domain-containing protein [Streptomyces sp. VRA16 Mangrove soil]|uniref:CBS domain-containing protein n=1 Tax=Streptomyces sp. VRA16 Mangrove soil TaxID=2817434 RepID=UPI001A9FF1CD|nr:CBS domain-containing protein [Streptomyces sp. VRA16 Mangrove soil]MBO1335696.1 CBS domain-containing protein [Streptomyces sp. VRA16 Mangrove soil]
MPHLVGDLMTSNVTSVDPATPLTQTAQLMRDKDIGTVLVCEGDRLLGLVTDRDIALRVVADGADPSVIDAGTVCTPDPVCVGPEEEADHAVALMRRHAVRRLPVVSDGRALGVITIGDLARERDPGSALADISRAAPSPGQGAVWP